MGMRRFIGQSKFSGDGRRRHIGFELFAREYDNGRWSLPTDFNAITATDIRRMLSEALLHLDFTTELISFNLEQRQFVDPDYVEAVALVQSRTPIALITELTERADDTVTLEQLQRGAKRFHDAGVKVCIDDVGTGSNDLDLVTALAPYVDEYKFALQNLRPFDHIPEIVPKLDYWYNFAEGQHKKLAIEGIETAPGVAELESDYPCDILQGYYLAKPAPLPKGNQLHWNF